MDAEVGPVFFLYLLPKFPLNHFFLLFLFRYSLVFSKLSLLLSLLRLPDGSSSERTNERDNRSIVGRVERSKNESLYPQIHSCIYLKLHISLRFYHPSLHPTVRLSIPCPINSLRRAGKTRSFVGLCITIEQESIAVRTTTCKLI